MVFRMTVVVLRLGAVVEVEAKPRAAALARRNLVSGYARASLERESSRA